MNPKINLSKIKECDQFWDSMTICKNGRICSKCNETIVDFRGLSDWEIALKHSGGKKKVCGIYDSKILDRHKKSYKQQSSRKKYILAGLIGMLTTSLPVDNQANERQVRSNILITNSKHKLSSKRPIKQHASEPFHITTDSIKILKGILKDESGEPLIGGVIVIDGTEKGVTTDINGQFEMDITEQLVKEDSITIIISYIGFGRKEKKINKTDFNQRNELDLDLVLDEKEDLIVFYVTKQPFHKRVCNKVKAIFKKKN